MFTGKWIFQWTWDFVNLARDTYYPISDVIFIIYLINGLVNFWIFLLLKTTWPLKLQQLIDILQIKIFKNVTSEISFVEFVEDGGFWGFVGIKVCYLICL